MNHVHVKEEKSLGALFSDLSREMQRLMRDEMALFKSEMSQKVTRGLKDISFVAIGGFVLYAGLLTVVAAVVFLLATAIPLWVSALVVGVIVLGIGYFLVKKGLKELKEADFTPRETLSTLKGDKEWLKKQT
jgi:ABC-type multidrug transport system fused ATPase/permease subunit